MKSGMRDLIFSLEKVHDSEFFVCAFKAKKRSHDSFDNLKSLHFYHKNFAAYNNNN